jgi:transcriptional regulator with XRE-family HTH domain
MACIFCMRDNLRMGTRRTISTEDGRKGHFIAEWLKHRKLTQEQLAAEAGYATSSINQLINGKQGYSQAALEAVAKALTCEPWELIAINPIEGDGGVDAKMAEKALRSAMIAYGVDRGQLDRAMTIIGTFVPSTAPAEQPGQTQPDGQSQPASRRRVSAP